MRERSSEEEDEKEETVLREKEEEEDVIVDICAGQGQAEVSLSRESCPKEDERNASSLREETQSYLK